LSLLARAVWIFSFPQYFSSDLCLAGDVADQHSTAQAQQPADAKGKSLFFPLFQHNPF